MVVCAGIHMSDIPGFPYDILWGSVSCAPSRTSPATTAASSWPCGEGPIRTHVTTYPLEAAGEALRDLRDGRFLGAAVLVP